MAVISIETFVTSSRTAGSADLTNFRLNSDQKNGLATPASK